MSKPLLAAGLLATMAGMWYWVLLPPVPQVASRPALPSAMARPPADVLTVRLGALTVEPATRPAPQAGRNPFARAVPAAAPGNSDATSVVVGSAAPRSAAPGPPTPSWPRLDLIGVAEAREDGGVVRVAIVSGPHGVHHARAGQLLEQVYRVERIAADGVDIRLLPEDRMLRLALRP